MPNVESSQSCGGASVSAILNCCLNTSAAASAQTGCGAHEHSDMPKRSRSWDAGKGSDDGAWEMETETCSSTLLASQAGIAFLNARAKPNAGRPNPWTAAWSPRTIS